MTEPYNNAHREGEGSFAASAYGPFADYCTRDERVEVPEVVVAEYGAKWPLTRGFDTFGVGEGLTFLDEISGGKDVDGVPLNGPDYTVDVHAVTPYVVGHDKVTRVGSLTGGHSASDT